MRRLIVAGGSEPGIGGAGWRTGRRYGSEKEVWAIFQQYAGTIGSTKGCICCDLRTAPALAVASAKKSSARDWQRTLP